MTFHSLRSVLTGSLLLCLLLLSNPAGAQTSISTNTVITPALTTIHAGDNVQFSVTQNGVQATNGYWTTSGGSAAGWIEGSGLYHAPLTVPSPAAMNVQYFMGPTMAQLPITLVNPRVQLSSISVSSLTQLATPVAIYGAGFLPSTVITVQGHAMPTTYVNENLIETTAVLTAPKSASVSIVVTNPNPGASSATTVIPAVFPVTTTLAPFKATGGWVTLTLTGTGYTPSSVVMLDGRPMTTTFNSATSLTGYGYLPPWHASNVATVTVVPEAGSPSSTAINLYLLQPGTSYDVAARFSTQAAFGPRPGLVEHIQQVGLRGFIKEQVQLPGVTYVPPTLPRYPYLQAVAAGNSLLRLRVAMALQTFVVNQGTFDEFPSYAPWETKLEADCLGNYLQLMTDMVSDARLGQFLDLAGNNASTDGTSHPNQNFAREFMQLFSLGTAMMNDDGSFQTDPTGAPVPTYDQNTIIDLSRAFTGWNFGPVVNQQYVSYGIDFSQLLAPFDQYHDHGAKTLFGSVNLPAGQSITADRTAAVNAIFNHPNLPPFLATRLIHQLVKSNPTPAYVSRISAVFKNNGKGVRGDMTAVVTAILLDPEARAGDTATQVGANEGFLQDPLLFEAFAMNILQQTQWDGQAIYLPGMLGEDFWHTNSVFGFYPATYLIPGTTTNSPQFSLLNNLTQLHRSQYLYGIITGATSGFQAQYQNTAWLYTAFTNLPDLVTALNHQLFHGQMPAATQSEILSYCAGIPDQQQAFTAAIFLAMNSDSFNVVH